MGLRYRVFDFSDIGDVWEVEIFMVWFWVLVGVYPGPRPAPGVNSKRGRYDRGRDDWGWNGGARTFGFPCFSYSIQFVEGVKGE
jgi:hypothetical protein